MAKKMYLSEDDRKRAIESVEKQLMGRFFGSSVSLSLDPGKDDRKATLLFTANAYAKMRVLVGGFATEVQWHGLVKRVDKNTFVVYDILVPPHEVTGATVTSDYKQFSDWLDGLDDDTFRAMKFHGHSHVNMAVTPSGVDTKFREDRIKILPKANATRDSFYIFIITNKKEDISGQIFDLTENAIYDTADIDFGILLDDGTTSTSFLADAKMVAIESKPAYKEPKKGKKKESAFADYYDKYKNAVTDDDDDDQSSVSPYVRDYNHGGYGSYGGYGYCGRYDYDGYGG